MRLNVSQLLKAPIGSTRSYKIRGSVDIDGDRMVRGEVKLIHTDRSILVRGTLHTEVETTCSRCLSLSNYPLTLNIEEEYFPTADVASGSLLPDPEEPSNFTVDEHHILNLTEATRQYVLLAIPMKPLCRENCAGLCPNCGHNLNQEPCDCPPQGIDPRWSELDKLALASDTLANKREGTE